MINCWAFILCRFFCHVTVTHVTTCFNKKKIWKLTYQSINYSETLIFETWTWTFSTIRSKALLRPGFWTFLGVHDRSWTFHERSGFWPFYDQKRSETVMKRSETVRNVGKFGNVKRRPRTFRNGERSKTFANHVHRFGEFVISFFSSRSRFKVEKNTVYNWSFVLRSFQ